MKEFQNSLPKGGEFLFCGVSGIPVAIRSWSEEMEVPLSIFGEGNGRVRLKVLEDTPILSVVGDNVIDGRRLLEDKILRLKSIGIDISISTTTKVWSDKSIVEEVVKILAEYGYTLSHSYFEDKSVSFVSPYFEVVKSIDEVVALRHAIIIASERLRVGSSFLPVSGGGRCGFLGSIVLKGDRGLLEAFAGGVLLHSPECTVFTNSSNPSFIRLNSSTCPHYVCYGKAKGALYDVEFNNDRLRLDCDYWDNTGNPYLILASIIEAGLMGVECSLSLPDEVVELNPTVTTGLVRLPMSLKEALNISEGSGFLSRLLGDRHRNLFFIQKTEECKAFDGVKGEAEYATYYSKLIKKG